MKSHLVAATALVAAGPVCAQNLSLKPLIDVRLRHEMVDQAGLSDDAEAATIRLRAGAQAGRGPWSVLVEAQGTLALADHYDDGLHGGTLRPLVADPENVALYRAQIQYRTQAVTLTAGRQRIALDDERFVGNAAFRQNAQTFDAVRAEWTGLAGFKADLSYVWNVRTIWGVEGNGARPRSVGGDSVLGNLFYATSLGTFTGFAYLVDQREVAVQGYRLSSQTYGGRLAGSWPLSKTAKLSYALSYARQTAYRHNPNRYAADYWLADVALDVKALKLNAGYEVLGAGDGTALTSFQTPLGTNFKFQGWADKLLTTPPDGVRDLYAGAGYGWSRIGTIDALSFQATWHRFASDRLDRHYGDEIDLLASAKIRRMTVSARFARYQAAGFASDTRKLWLQTDWAF
ncbi:MAG TPA: alginate export family protein [Sphingobium sp.]|nr:alginate export family protein [Sphingobium sp.]